MYYSLFSRILSKTTTLSSEYKKNLLYEARDFFPHELDILAKSIYEEEEAALTRDESIKFPEFKTLSIKNSDQIEDMRKSGQYLNELLYLLREQIKPGVKLCKLERMADDFMKTNSLSDCFRGFEGYTYHICTSVNDCLIHGIPDEYILQDGDILTIDAGVNYQGAITDAAISVVVGVGNVRKNALVNTARKCLLDNLEYIGPGKCAYDFAFHLYNSYIDTGYRVIKNCSGHGVGESLHEDPNIYHWPNSYMKNIIFEPGMTFAIEPLVTEKTDFVRYSKSDDVGYSEPGDFGAYFECTILITETGYEILAGVLDNNEIKCDSGKFSKLILKGKTYTVEIANDELSRERGLQFRDSLTSDRGMLFIFPENAEHPFWMKDTFISLDILWINENLRIIHIEDCVPIDDFVEQVSSFIPNLDARYVLEISAGEVKKLGVQIGDVVKIR